MSLLLQVCECLYSTLHIQHVVPWLASVISALVGKPLLALVSSTCVARITGICARLTQAKDIFLYYYYFFDDKRDNPDDTLLFYYSGHGVPGDDGNIYIASSDTDPDKPYRRSFSFEELRKRMENTIPTRVVVILDCCYSGSAKISKGSEEDVAKIGRIILEEKSRKLPEGQGKYILSSSQSHQEAYALTTGEHSIFTYYLFKGLKGNTESIDSEGNVTPQSLGNYVIRAIMSLPLDERPKQRPMLKTEESGNVILASYPDLRSPQPSPIMPIPSSPPPKSVQAAVHKGILRNKTKISTVASVTVVALILVTLYLSPFQHNTQVIGAEPYAVSINRLNNTVYVVNSGSNTVSVIDGKTNTVTATITVGKNPNAVSANPSTDMAYVANRGDNTVSVIDGKTNNVITVK